MPSKQKQEAAAVWMPIGDLTPWADNPRDNAAAIPEVAKSIKRFGFASPIIARPIEAGGFEIIAGHTRHQAALSLGLDRVPVRVMDLDPTDAKLLALADNKVGEIATWTDGLSDLLRDLETDGIDLDGLGFGDDELGELLAPLPIEPDGTEDDVPEVDEGEPDSKVGEVYQLGSHLLVCGDCLEPSVISLVGDGADAVVADPPYGTGIDAPGGLGNSSVPMSLVGDENPDLARQAVVAWKGVAPFQVWWGANYYSEAIEGSPCWLVWDKDHHGMTFADAELAWVNTRSPVRVFRHAWSGMHRASERGTVRQHPTQKPVALYEWTFDGRVKDGGVVVDPFGGSGSTLIACAMTGRVARLIELDPRYCDVIRRRWTAWAKNHGQDPGPGALE